jgi:hypothetical protein
LPLNFVFKLATLKQQVFGENDSEKILREAQQNTDPE